MRLVWHADLMEEDWIRWLLNGCVTDETRDLEMANIVGDAIHVVSGNITPLKTLAPYFSECRASGRPLILFQVSDEWLAGPYGNYKFFDAVFRNYQSALAEGEGIHTIPLGYPNGMQGPQGQVRPATQRALTWFFAGQIKSSRAEMLRHLSSIKNHRIVDTASGQGGALGQTEYKQALEDTVFQPCPMGNVMVETWRLYEALEWGAIPIVERRRHSDYYRRLLGENPIPAVCQWGEAAELMNDLLNDPSNLGCLQTEILVWWKDKKEKVRRNVREALCSPSRQKELVSFSKKPRNQMRLFYEPLRIPELLQHQTRATLLRRATRPARRAFEQFRKTSVRSPVS